MKEDRKIKAVIFDMDGVIADSEVVGKKCFILASEENGMPINEEVYMSVIGKTYGEGDAIMLAYYKDKNLLDAISKRHMELFSKAYHEGKVPLKKGAKEILSYLKENKIPHGLATSSPMRMVDLTFKSQGYSEFPFDCVTTGDEVNHGKPDPEIFLKAAKKLNVDIKNCLIVEDSCNGIKAARASTGISCLVPDILGKTDEMLQNADYCKDNLLEVIDIIKELS